MAAAAVVRSALPVASRSSSAALCNAPLSSAGLVGSGSLSELSAAMSVVVHVQYRPSILFLRAAAANERREEGLEGLGGGRRSRGSTRPARLLSRTIHTWSGQEGEGRRRRRRRKSSSTIAYANDETKEYGTPVPPYDARPQGRQSSHLRNVVKPSSGQGEGPKFWDYGSPRSLRTYTSPNSYGAPRHYGIPAYSAQTAARVAAVEVVEPPQGRLEEVVIVEPREIEPEIGDGDGGPGKDGGSGGGGGGGDGSGDGEDSEPQKPLSTAQKLTLVYAALVGVGGLIGFVKSGSKQSLISGGGAALALFLVYSQLPAHPTFASSFGLGISALLLGVMYPRFKRSGKFMPSGLVALVSLIMTGGYLHGIVRTAH